MASCFRSAFIAVRKLLKMSHPTVLFALSLMQCQRRLQISRVKNIGNVFELSGVAFCPAPPYGGLLVKALFLSFNFWSQLPWAAGPVALFAKRSRFQGAAV